MRVENLSNRRAWLTEGVHPHSLLGYLSRVRDPRRRQGRIYPLAGILAILILAALHGESSLRGMWVWAKEREEKLIKEKVLGFWGAGRLPALSAIWYLLRDLDGEALEGAIAAWAAQWGGISALRVDGKALRGSKRTGMPALQVVTEAVGEAGGPALTGALGD